MTMADVVGGGAFKLGRGAVDRANAPVCLIRRRHVHAKLYDW